MRDLAFSFDVVRGNTISFDAIVDKGTKDIDSNHIKIGREGSPCLIPLLPLKVLVNSPLVQQLKVGELM